MQRLQIIRTGTHYDAITSPVRRAQLADPESTILIPPEDYLAAVRQVLGIIDLDPCSTARAQLSVDAQSWYKAEDAAAALAEPWGGRVFLRPHPNSTIARYQIQKLLRDYLADRVHSAILLAGKVDWLRTEPLLLSFPWLFHYRRLPHWRWNREEQKLLRLNPSFSHFTLYLPARNGHHFDEERLARFIEAFSSHGRVILAEDFGDDWEQSAMLATRRMPIKPVLTQSRLNRYDDPAGASRWLTATDPHALINVLDLDDEGESLGDEEDLSP